MTIRGIESNDISALFDVRAATRENPYSRAELSDLGITEESVDASLRKNHRGWLCECEGKIAGFGIGDRSTGELSVIAVLREFEGRGFGTRLLETIEAWLFSAGCRELWLWTSSDPQKRAFRFYTARGWKVSENEGEIVYMKKKMPSQSPDPALASVTHPAGQGARHR